jgi:hypothetical protein
MEHPVRDFHAELVYRKHQESYLAGEATLSVYDLGLRASHGVSESTAKPIVATNARISRI